MLRAEDLSQWVDRVKRGMPASVFTDDVGDTQNAIEQIAESKREPARVVTLRWQHVPALGNELGLLVDALARATLELYPSLYGGEQHTGERWVGAALESAAHEITRRLDAVLGSACRQILSACHKGALPNIKKLSNSEQVRQLALAIDPSQLVILIAVEDAEASKGSLRALAQGAEWLASNTLARVILVLPSVLSAAGELDHVTYTACIFQSAVKAGPSAPPSIPRLFTSDKAEDRAVVAAAVSVSPIIGRPHPKSEAEQLLHSRISGDPELGLLFSYNQPIRTRYETNPVVDLLWEAGRLVIEIDGQEHCRLVSFLQDRRRDFELLMSGYQTIRFSRFKVLESPELVLNDIRDAVRYLGTKDEG